MRRIVLIIFSMLAFLSTPAIAGNNATRWTVTQRSGDARVVHPGLQPASMTVNQALAPGDVIVTGSSGRATLARGADYIVVAPHSRLRLPTKPQKAGFTAIIQDLGTLLYKVRHTGTPHFSVDTPMLAAVVKGTTFTVVVENDRSAVQVIEGVVEVTAADGGMQSLVHGGKTVFIERNNPKALITADAVTLGRPGDASGEVIKISGTEGESVLTVTAATAGQVRVEAPKVETTTKLATTTVVGALPGSGTTAPVTDVVSDVVAPVTDVVSDVVAPVTGVVAPVTDVVSDVIAPVTGVVAPVTGVVPDVAAPVIDVIVGVIAPVVVAPDLTTPTVTVPTVTTPEITTPVVTVPSVTMTVPTVTIPPVTLSLPF